MSIEINNKSILDSPVFLALAAEIDPKVAEIARILDELDSSCRDAGIFDCVEAVSDEIDRRVYRLMGEFVDLMDEKLSSIKDLSDIAKDKG
jgi:hypothetical protein